MFFRDVGYSQVDYGIIVQDVVYGVWKVKEEGCCVFENFDFDEYEKFEWVENGDFNWILFSFFVFVFLQIVEVVKMLEGMEGWELFLKNFVQIELDVFINQFFCNVLIYFIERNIGFVVCFNLVFYNVLYFEVFGIQYIDMIFEDGICLFFFIVCKFICLVYEMIMVRKKGIVVYCKVGFGCIGCLIGVYFIYRYGFIVNEVIVYMCFMCLGMVVGFQQYWFYLNQGVFWEWWFEECIERKFCKEMVVNVVKGVFQIFNCVV